MVYVKKGSRRDTNQENETAENANNKIDFTKLIDGVEKSIEKENPRTGKVYTSRLEAFEDSPATTSAKQEPTVLEAKPKDRPISSLTVEQAEIMAKKETNSTGRYIPNIDDAKPGVTFWQPKAQQPDALPFQVMNGTPALPEDGAILDTGLGAQVKEDIPIPELDDPRSDRYMSCMNKSCQYREGCLRYRLHNKKVFKAIFYPEECKATGIYQSINDTDFTAYDPYSNLESKNMPSPF